MSSKLKILEHHKNFIEFVQSLEKLDEQVLRTPITEGKWSIIQIVGHFQPWDEFLLEKRLPFIFSESTLPAAPNSFELNAEAAQLAEEHSVSVTLNNLISTRVKLLSRINTLPEENWSVKFKINQKTLTLETYLLGLIQHDLHHLNQIRTFIQV